MGIGLQNCWAVINLLVNSAIRWHLTKLYVEKITHYLLKLLSIMFLFKKNVKYFSSKSIWAITCVYAVILPFALKLLVHDVLRIICHFEFKRSSISFHKRRKQPVKYQHQSITHLKFGTCLKYLANQNQPQTINANNNK